jgi:hypothetical protein
MSHTHNTHTDLAGALVAAQLTFVSASLLFVDVAAVGARPPPRVFLLLFPLRCLRNPTGGGTPPVGLLVSRGGAWVVAIGQGARKRSVSTRIGRKGEEEAEYGGGGRCTFAHHACLPLVRVRKGTLGAKKKGS